VEAGRKAGHLRDQRAIINQSVIINQRVIIGLIIERGRIRGTETSAEGWIL